MANLASIRDRFETKAPTPDIAAAMAANRTAYADLAETIAKQGAIPSREQSLALTALEESKFWANQALILHGVATEPVASLAAEE